MGYDTSYSLKWEPLGEPQAAERRPNCEHKISKTARFCPQCGKPIGVIGLSERVAEEIKASEEMSYALCTDGLSKNADARWYKWKEDMKAVSLRIRDTLFTLHGEGADSGDMWNAYFLNGKCQEAKARIVYDPFDQEKLT